MDYGGMIILHYYIFAFLEDSWFDCSWEIIPDTPPANSQFQRIYLLLLIHIRAV
jgi:hypothetical protein